MRDTDFIKVEVSVDIDQNNGSIELKNHDYYWYGSTRTKPGDAYLEAISLIKSLMKHGRLSMITIDVLKGNTQSSTTENIYSLRMIERGAGEMRVSRFENNKYNFDDEDTITTQSPELFVAQYGAAANEQAMYHWIEWLKAEKA